MSNTLRKYLSDARDCRFGRILRFARLYEVGGKMYAGKLHKTPLRAAMCQCDEKRTRVNSMTYRTICDVKHCDIGGVCVILVDEDVRDEIAKAVMS